MRLPGAVAAARRRYRMAVAMRPSPGRAVISVVHMVIIVVIWVVVIVLEWSSSTRRNNVECLGSSNPRNGGSLGSQGLLLVLVGCLGTLEDVEELFSLGRWSG